MLEVVPILQSKHSHYMLILELCQAQNSCQKKINKKWIKFSEINQSINKDSIKNHKKFGK